MCFAFKELKKIYIVHPDLSFHVIPLQAKPVRSRVSKLYVNPSKLQKKTFLNKKVNLALKLIMGIVNSIV